MSLDLDRDLLLRNAAFQRLEELSRTYSDLLPWSVLNQGFPFRGDQVRFLGPRGIFKPAQMDLPLSITTAPEKPGRPRPYDDELGPDGFLRYRYQGTDPGSGDNKGLRECFVQGLPLIYFHGVASGSYQALWPAFIHGDDPGSLTFVVAVDDPQLLDETLATSTVDDARRAYTTRLAVQRLHQTAFRHKVLAAYRTTCAICRLRNHPELLGAAHILSDSRGGEPVVPNGLALCKIHHAAFDGNVVGIRPDLVVQVNDDVLAEIDGPMLRFGLQGMHHAKLIVPRSASDRPDRHLLEERYEEFRQAS